MGATPDHRAGSRGDRHRARWPSSRPTSPPTTKAFTFETAQARHAPASWSFQPPRVVFVIGVLFVMAVIPAFLGPRFDRTRRVGPSRSALRSSSRSSLAIALCALSDEASTNVTNLLVGALVLTPYALGAMTGLWCEHSGHREHRHRRHDACRGWRGVHGLRGWSVTPPTPVGSGSRCVVAVLTGGVLGALHAWLTVTFRVNQIISGVVINLLALGLTGFLRSQVIVKQDIVTGQALPTFGIPLARSHPGHRQPAVPGPADLLPDAPGGPAHRDRHVQDAVGPAGAIERREPTRRRDPRASTSS